MSTQPDVLVRMSGITKKYPGVGCGEGVAPPRFKTALTRRLLLHMIMV